MADAQALSHLSALLESVGGPCAVLDPEGTVVLVNEEWRTFGDANGLVSENHAIGTNYLTTCAGATGKDSEGAGRLLDGLRDVIAGRIGSFRHAYPCHSPVEQRWYQCQIKRLSAPDQELLVLVHHVDISEQLRLIEERKRREALELANEVMQQFVYALSHDMHAPLRAIVEFSKLIKERHLAALPEEGRELFGFVEDGGTRMTSMLHGLLSYVRATDLTEAFQRTELGDVVRDAISDLGGPVQQTGAEITVEGLPVVMGYREMLRLVFRNLIDNAIKYRGERPARIEISAQDKKDEWVVSVRDHGIGIDQSHAEFVFRIFRRTHLAEDVSGEGIGLAICKRIVDLHRGRIWVEPHDGDGALICFSISKRLSA